MGKGGRKDVGVVTVDATNVKETSPTTSPTNTNTKKDAKQTSNTTLADSGPDYSRPWWCRGGMHVNMVGMIVTIAGPIFAMTRDIEKQNLQFYISLLAISFATSAIMGMRTLFCIVVVPSYMVSMSLALTLPYPALVLLASLLLAIVKVGVCMSVCLHRYAAHAAFKCGYFTRLFVTVLGCLANQGGPIWWASQHRCHHKFCDIPRDPHSAQLDGEEAAFAFFDFPSHQYVIEEFAPFHQDTKLLRIMDTWSFMFVGMEFLASYYFLGMNGLFISYTSAWFCQCITLWFNVANHPAEVVGACKAANERAKPQKAYPPWLLFDLVFPLFATVVGEKNHEHHHDHANLAKRSDKDLAYLFVLGLESLGLVWNVRV
jgi:fatty-acid desaturase